MYTFFSSRTADPKARGINKQRENGRMQREGLQGWNIEVGERINIHSS
jgi:hypothetical protein